MFGERAAGNEETMIQKRAGGRGETKAREQRAEGRGLVPVRRSPLAMMSDACMALEKVRVGATIRLSHLERHGQTCADTEDLQQRSKQLEDWADSKLGAYLSDHPAHWWFSRVKGIGKENIAKVIGRIEAFGRYYKPGDPFIPAYVTRAPEAYRYVEDGEVKEGLGVWVEGIERLTTPSKLRVLSGHAPGMRREAGKRHPYDATLKMLTWRLGTSLMKAEGKFYNFYSERKEYLRQRAEAEGVRITPTPQARFCLNCEREVIKKAARFCPDCGQALSQKREPPGVLYEGHVHNMAKGRMEQMFLDLLWVVWREALGLPLRVPYPIEYGGHSRVITPEDMTDKPPLTLVLAVEPGSVELGQGI